MATPSSSQTTPSPSLSHVEPLTTSNTDASAEDAIERDTRQTGLQRFLARAELSKLTRGLRARLLYASYKTTHNLTNVPLRTLEVQLAAKAPPPVMPKRKAGSSNYYNNPVTQGHSAATGVIHDNLRRNTLSHYPNVGASTSNATHSLFNSLLAPPPSKRVRTIHNPEMPPVTSPPRIRKPAVGNKTAGRHEKAKGRMKKKALAAHRAGSQSSFGEGENNYQDIQAAAALTDMLLSRPMPVASPRSSISTVSDAGSSHSYPMSLSQQFARSAARLGPGLQQTASTSSNLSVSAIETRRSTTPTPKAALARPVATDNEAADLILSFANSPSPARPTVTRDANIARNVYAAGRVLFQDGARSGGGSFSSAVSVANGDPGGASEKAGLPRTSSEGFPIRADGVRSPSSSSIRGKVSTPPLRELVVTPPLPAGRSRGAMSAQSSVSHLLPPPPSPASGRRLGRPPSGLVLPMGQIPVQATGPSTPTAFDMVDFLNVSPAPATPGRSRLSATMSAPAPGRRLYDADGVVPPGVGRTMPYNNLDSTVGLGSGIDLVKT